MFDEINYFENYVKSLEEFINSGEVKFQDEILKLQYEVITINNYINNLYEKFSITIGDILFKN